MLRSLFVVFAMQHVTEMAWLTEARQVALAARYMLLNQEYEVTQAEKEFVRSILIDFLAEGQRQAVQEAIDGHDE